jgi:CRISPR system Cascade subunit CasD
VTVLLLRLAAPLQSWGTSSRFVRRGTGRAPSKSGVIGLLAAAEGRRRTDPLEDLLHLRVGVRVEQPGRLERDFQTARPRDGSKPMPLSYRFYLADAVFLAAVEGDRALLEGLHEALRRPVFPLFLGRRSCPPAGPISRGLREGTALEALTAEPWAASARVQRAEHRPSIVLDTVLDCPPGQAGSDVVRDVPLSFDPTRREYGWRSVCHGYVELPNPRRPVATGFPASAGGHDCMSALDGP